MAWSLLGLSAQQQAEREVADLNSTKDGFKDWNILDSIRSGITQVSKEEILKRAQKIAADQINETNKKLIGETNTALSGTPLNPDGGSTKYKPGQTEAEFVSSLNTDKTRGTIALNLLNDEDFTGTIDPNAGVGDLTRLSGQTKKAKRAREEGNKRRDASEQRAHETGLLTKQLQATEARYNHEFRNSEARRAHEAEQAQLDRMLSRDLDNNRFDMQMQIAQMDSDLADKRMEYDRETNRLDRRDRAIAQLMAGLGQLGGAFSL